MDKIRIVLAEDHAIVRKGTRQLVTTFPDFEVVGEASDGRQALEIVGSLKPDILICDIKMPQLDGIAVACQISDYCPETRVLLLTAYDDEGYVLAALRAGVAGYIMKTADVNELAEAIRAVHLGQSVAHSTIAAKITQLAIQNWPDTRRLELLSSRELEILSLVAKDISNQAIAEELNISPRTVDSHLGRTYAKLGVSSRAAAAQYYRSYYAAKQ